MIIKLFDIENGVVVPTEHCYTLKALKDVMDEYPEEHLKIYLYLLFILFTNCPILIKNGNESLLIFTFVKNDASNPSS